ncbi:hypothetical protein AB0O67_03090 [Streptomyces sp. NPDC086077]|uniref:hypothetical protein n=1 Tax=Streptomyces sp. NPDC086077 TaxID=3154862 RepID=UPI0034469DF9
MTPEPPGNACRVDGIRALEETAAELETAVALRYGILYGPGTWNAPGGAVAAALTGDPGARLSAYLDADRSVTSFGHVSDAARATVAALNQPHGGGECGDHDSNRMRGLAGPHGPIRREES